MLIRLAADETLVGLERVQEPTLIDDEEDEALEGSSAATDAASEPDTTSDIEQESVLGEDEQQLSDESSNPEE